MTSVNSKLILSALGVALLATPALAAPNEEYGSALLYTPPETIVVVEGAVVGADPDGRIRGALAREWESLRGE
jgi:hypothetical protein